MPSPRTASTNFMMFARCGAARILIFMASGDAFASISTTAPERRPVKPSRQLSRKSKTRSASSSSTSAVECDTDSAASINSGIDSLKHDTKAASTFNAMSPRAVSMGAARGPHLVVARTKASTQGFINGTKVGPHARAMSATSPAEALATTNVSSARPASMCATNGSAKSKKSSCSASATSPVAKKASCLTSVTSPLASAELGTVLSSSIPATPTTAASTAPLTAPSPPTTALSPALPSAAAAAAGASTAPPSFPSALASFSPSTLPAAPAAGAGVGFVVSSAAHSCSKMAWAAGTAGTSPSVPADSSTYMRNSVGSTCASAPIAGITTACRIRNLAQSSGDSCWVAAVWLSVPRRWIISVPSSATTVC
mmetsp:Transcript_29265/g.76674  ORF Transcript_29265/g.76674 Transcript_29265/m.76674 type:complete len:369 (-) Transcript_29265:1059-2165(-)